MSVKLCQQRIYLLLHFNSKQTLVNSTKRTLNIHPVNYFTTKPSILRRTEAIVSKIANPNDITESESPLEICEEEEPPPSYMTENYLDQNLHKQDNNFFSKLRKTSTKYWMDHSEEIFERFDWNKLLDDKSKANFEMDLKRRQSEVDVDKIRQLMQSYQEAKSKNSENDIIKLRDDLVRRALVVPNTSHPASSRCLDETPSVIFTHGNPRDSNGVEEFHSFCENRGYLRTNNLGNLAMSKSYLLMGPLAELEQALIHFTLNWLESAGFQVISVPDILEPHIIEACGFPTRGERDQIFWLDYPGDPEKELCLSGTAEMGIASLLQNKVLRQSDLPLKLAAVSRCYRAETSSVEEERGLYRVHEFTKVEMFGVTADESGTESNELQEQFKILEENKFSELGLHFRTLEMPPVELGTSAHRKFDIEAWMPAKNMFGEISSCSNCTDFQSRRLNIRYKSDSSGELKYVHTVNGTACAVPRMLISLGETFQSGGTLDLPSCLRPFMIRSWEEAAAATKNVKTQFLRNKSQQEKISNKFLDW